MEINKDCYIVAIGASAGGIEAIFKFFDHVKENPDIAYVVIRHLKRDQESFFSDLLKKHCSLPIVKVKGGEIIKPNHVYLMPETHKMTVTNRTLNLIDRPEKEIINHSINEFFHSLAADVKEKAIGIVLSGFMMDGAHGAKDIKAKGGTVLVQDPITATVGTMPLQTILLDHPDYIVPAEKMYEKVLQAISDKSYATNRKQANS